MEDLPEKTKPTTYIRSPEFDSDEAVHSSGVVDIPQGWKYKRFFGLPYYASPQFQLVLVAFVCFLCPGQ